MIARLSPRDRRTLAMGAAVIAGLVLFARGLPAWRRWDADTRASAAEMVAEAARVEASARALPAALDSLQARRARFVAVGRGVLEGESAAAAGASLASLLSAAAARSGVQLGSVQVRPDSAGAGSFLRVTATADGTGDLPAVTRMLALLESGPELLAVRDVSINQPNPGGPADQPEALRVQLTVQGLALVSGVPLPRPAPAPRADDAEEDTGAEEAADPPAPDGGPAPASTPPRADPSIIYEPTPP